MLLRMPAALSAAGLASACVYLGKAEGLIDGGHCCRLLLAGLSRGSLLLLLLTAASCNTALRRDPPPGRGSCRGCRSRTGGRTSAARVLNRKQVNVVPASATIKKKNKDSNAFFQSSHKVPKKVFALLWAFLQNLTGLIPTCQMTVGLQ
jgi:hypothetical protein